jgi:hypothetical protein
VNGFGLGDDPYSPAHLVGFLRDSWQAGGAAGRTGLTAAHGAPAVTVAATAADLITLRLGPSAAERKAALRRVKFDGDRQAIDAMRAAFILSGDPGLLVD